MRSKVQFFEMHKTNVVKVSCFNAQECDNLIKSRIYHLRILLLRLITLLTSIMEECLIFLDVVSGWY